MRTTRPRFVVSLGVALTLMSGCGPLRSTSTRVPVQLTSSFGTENWYVDTIGHSHRDLAHVEIVSRTRDEVVVRIGGSAMNSGSFVEVTLTQDGTDNLAATLAMKAHSHLVSVEELPVYSPSGWVRSSTMNLNHDKGLSCEFGVVGEWQSESMYARGHFLLRQ